jgi:hypothetical protein
LDLVALAQMESVSCNYYTLPCQEYQSCLVIRQGFPILAKGVKKKSFPSRIQKTSSQGRLSMDSTTLCIPTDVGLVAEPSTVTSLYEALHQLSDARRGQGKRYELALILCLLVLAKLAGQTTLSGATEWIRHRAASLADHFGLCAIRACRAR